MVPYEWCAHYFVLIVIVRPSLSAPSTTRPMSVAIFSRIITVADSHSTLAISRMPFSLTAMSRSDQYVSGVVILELWSVSDNSSIHLIVEAQTLSVCLIGELVTLPCVTIGGFTRCF